MKLQAFGSVVECLPFKEEFTCSNPVTHARPLRHRVSQRRDGWLCAIFRSCFLADIQRKRPEMRGFEPEIFFSMTGSHFSVCSR